MATLNTMVPAAGGSTLALVAATAGAQADKYRNTGKELLVVNNGGGSPITVTRVAKRACSQGTMHDNVVSVTNGTTEYLPPLDPNTYSDDDGWCFITFSAVASVTVGVLSPS